MATWFACGIATTGFLLLNDKVCLHTYARHLSPFIPIVFDPPARQIVDIHDDNAVDARYNLRPELIESMYYIYKATGARGWRGRAGGVQGLGCVCV